MDWIWVWDITGIKSDDSHAFGVSQKEERFIEMNKMTGRAAVELSESNTISFSCRAGRYWSFFSQAPDEDYEF